MTAIDFHTKVPDVVAYACRILKIAYGKGASVVVYHDDGAALQRFNDTLWSFSALDFIPHALAGSTQAAESPIVLTSSDVALPHHAVILNLSLAVPPMFSSFERLIEFVPASGEPLLKARERYKFYKDRGYPIKTHEFRENQR